MYSISGLRKCVRRGYVVLKLYMALEHGVTMHRQYYIAISFICLISGLVLFVTGISTLPSRPPTRTVGSVTTGLMSDSEYSSLITHSAAFAEFMIGAVIFIIGALVHRFRVDKEEGRLPEGAVAPAAPVAPVAPAAPVSILKKEVRFDPPLTP